MEWNGWWDGGGGNGMEWNGGGGDMEGEGIA